MAAALSLESIVRQDCISAGDCMLTLTDDTGEAGFLYFKEGELIEANFSSLWGKDALTEILKWRITGRALASLPLGIKRSLWEPLNVLLHPATPAGGTVPVPAARPRRPALASAHDGLDHFRAIPNLLRMVELKEDDEILLFEGPPERGELEDTRWLADFAARVRAVGETLGFGAGDKWTLDTDRNQIVGFHQDGRLLALVRRKDAMQEDLETAIAAAEVSD